MRALRRAVKRDVKLQPRGGFRHVQHVRLNRGPHKKGPHKRTSKFLQHSIMPEIIEIIIIIKRFFLWRAGVIKCQVVLPAGNLHTALLTYLHNSSYSTPGTPSVLCAYNYVMRVLNKMSTTTLSLCVSCEFSRSVFVY